MKKVRNESETRSDYTNRVQKQRYHNDEEYKYKIKLNYYKNKYKDVIEFENIFKDDDITNIDKFKKVKMLCVLSSV